MISVRKEFYFFFINIEASIETSRIETIIPRESRIGISMWKNEVSILIPTNVRTKATPVLRYLKYPMIPFIAKYSDLSPRIAKMFEV
jgi:hypothetical protein